MFSFVYFLIYKSHKPILIKSKSKKYCLRNGHLSYETKTFVSGAKERWTIKKATVFHIICKKLGLRLTTTYFIASGGNERFTSEFHF